jgi:hypothetical protein
MKEVFFQSYLHIDDTIGLDKRENKAISFCKNKIVKNQFIDNFRLEFK